MTEDDLLHALGGLDRDRPRTAPCAPCPGVAETGLACGMLVPEPRVLCHACRRTVELRRTRQDARSRGYNHAGRPA